VTSSVVQTSSSNTYTSSTLNVGDIVSCTLTSNATCISTTTANSNSITMITNVPVTLVSFKAYLSEHDAKCAWQTSTETDAAYYVVQRSTNGKEFIDLGRIQATGNSNTVNNYNYTDINAADLKVNAIYYRLQMFDKDGHSTYSKVVMITLKTTFEIGLYPNPAKDRLNVKIYNSRSLNGTLYVTDIQGRVLLQQSLNLDANVDGNSVYVNTTSLNTGNYLVVIKDENGIEQKQFMKQ
ncbi:MAG: T9SS type A sorting domain-containing protein, partial [Bacteroidota bacterium]